RLLGHYWGSGSGYCQVYVGDNSIGNKTCPFPKMCDDYREEVMFLDGIQCILYFVYKSMFNNQLSPLEHPLLFATPTHFNDKQREDLLVSLFSYLEIPYIALVDSSLLVLVSHSMMNSTAIVASAGARHLTARAFESGKPLTELCKVVKISSWEEASGEEQRIEKDFIEKIANDLANAIQETVESIEESKRETILRNIILTGGRAHAIKEQVEKLLKEKYSRTVIQLHISMDPAFDVANGFEPFLALPDSKELFVCIDQINELIDTTEADLNSEEYSSHRYFLSCWDFTRKKLFPASGTYDAFYKPNKLFVKEESSTTWFIDKAVDKASQFDADGISSFRNIDARENKISNVIIIINY
ncbi:hypothetical protein HK096_004642, partial [Nowakowskiella sp. JEL0078]